MSRFSIRLISPALILLALVSGPLLLRTACGQDDARRAQLAGDPSAYVRRHADDLVHWNVWSDAIFERARQEKKPLYVCIGYDSCHWCLKMQHESFENPDIARLLNDNFISVIVDKDRLPVLNGNFITYMNANQGQSGWPLNVWITPDRVPFSVGSYFPSDETAGEASLPDFTKVLNHIISQWKRFPDYIDAQSKRDLEKLKTRLAELDQPSGEKYERLADDDAALRMAAYEAVATRYDPLNGGFSNPFQFPQTGVIRYLLALRMTESDGSFRGRKAEEMVRLTCEKMARGGIFDLIGGGFHRYALDAAWQVPRFEKLLVTQAAMADCYLRAYQVTDEAEFADVVRSTLSFVTKDLAAADGLFFSGLQSDSVPPGGTGGDAPKEGAYYSWDYDAFVAAAGAEAGEALAYMTGVRPGGNLSPEGNANLDLRGKNILRREHTLAETAEKFGLSEKELLEKVTIPGFARLAEARASRPAPAKDENVLCGWNALMASALCRAGTVLGDVGLSERGSACLDATLTKFYDTQSGLLYNVADDGGRSGVYAFSYAAVIAALLDGYETALDDALLARAIELQAKQDELFWDDKEGGYFEATADDSEDFLRLKNIASDVAESTNALALSNLLRLATVSASDAYEKKALAVRKFALPRMVSMPTAVATIFESDYHLQNPPQLIVVTGAADSDLARAVVTFCAKTPMFRTALLRVGADTPTAKANPLVPEPGDGPSVVLIRDGKTSPPMQDIAALKAALSQ